MPNCATNSKSALTPPLARCTSGSMPGNRRTRGWDDPEAVAGNGLLDRRVFLTGGAAFAAAITGYTLSDTAAAQQLVDAPWSTRAGMVIPDYGVPSRFEKDVARTLTNPRGEPRTQHGRTPHHVLNGTFTPNGLHFVISHSGNPDIDPNTHRLVIHGLVRRPLAFTLNTLSRYPMQSRMTFVECGGNSAPLFSRDPVQANVQALHGLVGYPGTVGTGNDTHRGQGGEANIRRIHGSLLRMCWKLQKFAN